MATAPYSAALEARIRDSIIHAAAVDVYPPAGSPFQVDPSDLTVEFDESWSPRGRATFTCKVPADPAQRLALDGRRAARVKVSLGYIDETGVPELHLAGDLVLQAAVPSYPGEELVVDAVTDEILAQEDIYRAVDGTPPVTGVKEFLTWTIQKAVAPYVPVITTTLASAWNAALVADVAKDGAGYWSMIEEVALRAGLYVYVRDSREWVIAPRSAIAAPTGLLRTGPRGTILALSEPVDRRTWHNSVYLRYTWRDGAGADQVRTASRTATSGPYAAATVGRKTFRRDINIQATQAQADAAAAELLKAVLGRGTSITLEAVAAYWLRPGMTITVRFPDGTTREVIAARVSFRPYQGLMTITTKTIADITTTA